MTSLPIVARELLAASRKRRTVWTRVQSAAAGIVLGGCVLLLSDPMTPQQLGGTLFGVFAWLIFFYCAFAGAIITSGCICTEKAEGTLGLLFLTELRGYDVVLGKLAASSLTAVYGVLTLFPVLAISFVLGGVEIQVFGRVFLAAFNLLFLSLSAGILASTLCDRESRAFALTLVILAALHLGPVMLGLGFTNWLSSHTFWLRSLINLCPWQICVAAFEFKKEILDRNFVAGLGITHLYAWLFLAISFRRVSSVWEQHDTPEKWRGIKSSVRRFTEGSEAVKKAWRSACLDKNPYFWRTARAKHLDRLVWLLILASLAGWFLFPFKMLGDNGASAVNPDFCFFGAFALLLALKVWIAIKSARPMNEDHRTGAFELVLCTPITPERIIAGQWLGLRAQFGSAVAAVLIIEALLFSLSMLGTAEPRPVGARIVFWTANLVGACADIWALVWTSMDSSLKSKSPVRAASWALAKILVLPWIVGWIIASLVDYFGWMPRISTNDYSAAMFLYFGAVFISWDLAIGWLAKRRLWRSFKRLAVA